MQLKEGARVFSADGKRIGTLSRVVLEPCTKQVTSLVVEKGFMFAHDKVIPMSLVGPTTEDRVSLRVDAADLEELPDFEELDHVPAETEPQDPLGAAHWARPLYWYPPIGSWWTASGYAGYARPIYVERTRRNIPKGTVALEEDAPVISRDGKHVGDVERVFTDPLEDRATHLLLSRGLLLKEEKLIPTKWITNVLERAVHLSVESSLVDSLPDYQS
jgi:uncharacterized protein YrrD